MAKHYCGSVRTTGNSAARETRELLHKASHNRESLHSAPGETLTLHPAWQALIGFCREMEHGEIERIKIQDGLPVSAEVVTRKIRWC